jgi:hypothetical protein
MALGRRDGIDSYNATVQAWNTIAARNSMRHSPASTAWRQIYWMRHTGKWWRLHVGVTLVEALRILETDGTLHPV